MNDSLVVAFFAVVGVIAAMTMLTFLVNTIPQTNPSEGDLFFRSVDSTISLLLVPSIVIIALAFLAFLVFILKLHS